MYLMLCLGDKVPENAVTPRQRGMLAALASEMCAARDGKAIICHPTERELWQALLPDIAVLPRGGPAPGTLWVQLE